MKEASHLSSMSFNVASAVDFFAGMTAVDAADFVGAAVVFVGEEAFDGLAGELLLSAAGDADFSVDTETLGLVAGASDFSGMAASGVGAGVEASS